MRRPFSIQLLIVRVSSGIIRYLLLKRRPLSDGTLPGFWQGVTGGLECEETFHQAAVREAFEETRIKLSVVQEANFIVRYPIRMEWRRRYGDGPSEIEERLFFSVLTEEFDPVLSEEHTEWRWCAFTEAHQLLSFGTNRQALEAVDVLVSAMNSSVTHG